MLQRCSLIWLGGGAFHALYRMFIRFWTASRTWSGIDGNQIQASGSPEGREVDNYWRSLIKTWAWFSSWLMRDHAGFVANFSYVCSCPPGCDLSIFRRRYTEQWRAGLRIELAHRSAGISWNRGLQTSTLIWNGRRKHPCNKKCLKAGRREEIRINRVYAVFKW